MAYALYTDVASEFKSATFGASTAVTSTQVTEWIARASAFIDAKIASAYSVPVTGPNSLLILKDICVLLVKSRINSVLSVKTPQDSTKQDPDGPSLYKQAMAMLKEIQDGTLTLTDASALSEGGMTSYLIDEEIENQFTMEGDNW